MLRSQRIGAIGKLAGGLAHDLSNLLAPIRMSCELLKRKLVDSELVRFVDLVQDSNDKARSSIERLRAFTRGTEDARPERLAAADLLHPLRAFVAEQRWPDTIKYEVSASSDLPLVEADPERLYEAVCQLLLNARESITSDSGIVELQLSRRDFSEGLRLGDLEFARGRYLRVDVRDSGCGVPHELQERIFDPFFSTKPKGSAPGLGLTIAAAIVNHCGGYIDLHSQPDSGTRMTLYLPEALNT